MSIIKSIDIEDVLGVVGVAVVAGALYLVDPIWMLLFLGVVLIGLAAWMARTRRGPTRG